MCLCVSCLFEWMPVGVYVCESINILVAELNLCMQRQSYVDTCQGVFSAFGISIWVILSVLNTSSRFCCEITEFGQLLQNLLQSFVSKRPQTCCDIFGTSSLQQKASSNDHCRLSQPSHTGAKDSPCCCCSSSVGSC